MKNQKRQSGSSMMEVLVSLVILAVGMLGMSSIQSTSLRSNQSAYLRTQATIYSFDIVERMRANLLGIQSGSYNNIAGAAVAACLSAAGGGCSSGNLASNDISEWKATIVAGMPSGSATVCLDSTPSDGTSALPACDGAGEMYAVKIWWDDNRDGSADQNFVMSFRP